MQFNLNLIATSILVATSPVFAADFIFFTGPDCTGSVIASIDETPPSGVCIGIGLGLSAEPTKSVSYSGVPIEARFFVSQVLCTGLPIVTAGPGSGCATAPDG
ncbi:hypothetical protein FB45DRAFT_1034160 [Roridomyces roridus]|uniref:Uncharacterized protein n=1 Tax=Roridomyces roridus TaxID=1738132 RepID=A0AAD7BDH5_9AGAR|nr:hypothetical protein FB45DRAFT_1034160 [Roridomyces roridus]